MARKVKCPICEKMNDKEDTTQIGNRYYCKECGEQKRTQSTRNKNDWNELFEYICEIYGIPRPTGMMFKQLKDFRSEPYNYKDKGMYLTLKYFYETLGHEVKEDTGLGIIPYYYERAKQHFIDILKIESYMDEFEPNEKESTVTIDKNKLQHKVVLRKRKQYDSIHWEEE